MIKEEDIVEFLKDKLKEYDKSDNKVHFINKLVFYPKYKYMLGIDSAVKGDGVAMSMHRKKFINGVCKFLSKEIPETIKVFTYNVRSNKINLEER